MVPRTTFEDAWSDSGHEMLVTDTAPPLTGPADNAPVHEVPPEGADPGAADDGTPPQTA